ncbi:hypothetical protein [Parapedobacter tibetensis]|uniref:hypothetical protein n=1 Tax=Parapedobacter tibetensis TaxID=2972951 RepID=UPI00214DCD48|nr:hypothetical protein [Parapedobacter tibetensis]
MQTRLFNIFDEKADYLSELDSKLSFDKFISHLKALCAQPDEGKREMFAFILDRFLKAQEKYGPIAENNLEKFNKELYYVYCLLVPLFNDEQTAIWGLGHPVHGKIIYGTDTFYDFLKKEYAENNCMGCLVSNDRADMSIQVIYSLILERLYDVHLPNMEPLVYTSMDEQTGLPKYYSISVDYTFVDVKPKGELPPLNYERLRGVNVQKQIDWRDILTFLPLKNFQIEGFSIITMTDNCQEQVMENIKRIIINRTKDDRYAYQAELEQSLRILTGNPHLHIGLTPLLRVNGIPVIEPQLTKDSILFNQLLNSGHANGTVVSLVNEYLENPYPITYNLTFGPSDTPSSLIAEIAKLAICCYTCAPLYFNNEVVGLLEIHTIQDHRIDKSNLPKLRATTPLLAQLSYNLISDFDNKLDAIIKDRFTGLQPSVHWKFNQAAWEYLFQSDIGKTPASVSNIYFNNVYPLYGAVDVRNSTLERNLAIIGDLENQLQVLMETLEAIGVVHHFPDLDTLISKCNYWKSELSLDVLDHFQFGITDFLSEEISILFRKLKPKNQKIQAIIERYEADTDQQSGFCYARRRAFESSLMAITNTISRHLDVLNEEVQQCYPSYFERFRTDGVEHDIYVGQSITPGKKFEKAHLTQIQYMQLSAMASITQATSTLKPSIALPLETTQLIFINTSDIDISFRVDERRFDVEGSYNVRYHVIKKRIDKVLVKNTFERLTQPGKIALVYFHEDSIKDYRKHIAALQHQGMLLDDLEKLELQELQGVNGLKALRVGVHLS